MERIPEYLVAKVYEFFHYADRIRVEGFFGWKRIDMLEDAQGSVLMYLPNIEFAEQMLWALIRTYEAHQYNPLTTMFFSQQRYQLECLIEELQGYTAEEVPQKGEYPIQRAVK